MPLTWDGGRGAVPVLGAGSGRVRGGVMETAGVIRSGRRPARIIAARTAAAVGAWYSQKQISSSGARTAPRNRTGAPWPLAWRAARAMALAPGPAQGV
jgi:hypothetical protein